MFAEVAISNAPPKLDKLYHYAIPDGLKDKITIGSCVLVPFGKSRRTGYVVGFSEKSDVLNIKDIERLDSDIPAFDENSLRLVKWLSEYYFCFFGTALRAILPPSIRNK